MQDALPCVPSVMLFSRDKGILCLRILGSQVPILTCCRTCLSTLFFMHVHSLCTGGKGGCSPSGGELLSLLWICGTSGFSGPAGDINLSYVLNREKMS